MNYKTAMAGVFAKYRSPRTRSHVAGLLERYSADGRPVTAWHALGEDAAAARLLLEGLGFREKEDFEVQTSVLDPGASRFSWTDEGLKLVQTMPGEIHGVDFKEVQRRILVPGDRLDPLELLDDVSSTAVAAEGPALASEPDLVDRTLAAVRDIANRVMARATAAETAEQIPSEVHCWAKQMLAGEMDGAMAPMAPLGVLESLARAEGVPDLPGRQVFSVTAPATHFNWQAARPMRFTETFRPAGRINCLPLEEQHAQGSNCALEGYLAWTVDEWRTCPRGRDAVWTQFDAPLVRSADALNFALDAERMRRFVQKIVENGYRGFGCMLSGTTRLGVHNTALGHSIPGNQDLSCDDGDTSQFEHRIEDSEVPDCVLYMGAYVIAEVPAPASTAWAPPTHPVKVVENAGQADEKSAAESGITTGELAEEWFEATHGGCDWDATSVAARLSAPDAERVARLAEFRKYVAALKADDRRILSECDADSFKPDGIGRYSRAGAFVNGLCAAMRKYGAGGLEFLEDSPYRPEKFVPAVWSGISTDLAPSAAAEAAEAGVFPNVLAFPIRSEPGYKDKPDGREDMTNLLTTLRSVPQVQFRFGKRSKGFHRKHVILVETNVRAKRFLEGADLATLRQAAWRAFYGAFLMGRHTPFDALDGSFGAFRNPGHPVEHLADCVQREAADWYLEASAEVYPAKAPDDFLFGWREDSLGRLILVVATGSSAMALRAKLVYRLASGLPLATASYLVEHGTASVAVLAPGTSSEKAYLAVLGAAVRQPGFMFNCGTTNGSCGRLGTIWVNDLVWDMDSDEVPGRAWYLDPHGAEPVTPLAIGNPV